MVKLSTERRHLCRQRDRVGKDEDCQQDAGGPVRAWNAGTLAGIGIWIGKDEDCQQDAGGPVRAWNAGIFADIGIWIGKDEDCQQGCRRSVQTMEKKC